MNSSGDSVTSALVLHFNAIAFLGIIARDIQAMDFPKTKWFRFKTVSIFGVSIYGKCRRFKC